MGRKEVSLDVDGTILAIVQITDNLVATATMLEAAAIAMIHLSVKRIHLAF